MNPKAGIRVKKAIYLLGDADGITQRPDHADVVEIFHCEADGVVMPWPVGMTLKEAILQWAAHQKEEERT